MNYVLFILFSAGITFFITESKVGLFIRENPLITKKPETDIPLCIKETLHDLLCCAVCSGFWIGSFLSFYFEYESANLILLNSLFGPTLYGFLSSITSFLICSFMNILIQKINRIK